VDLGEDIMEDLYQWLYDNYVLPELQETAEEYDTILSKFAERVSLTQTDRLRLIDLVTGMRLEWGTNAFVLGIRFGMELKSPRVQSKEPDWLLRFLP